VEPDQCIGDVVSWTKTTNDTSNSIKDLLYNGGLRKPAQDYPQITFVANTQHN